MAMPKMRSKGNRRQLPYHRGKWRQPEQTLRGKRRYMARPICIPYNNPQKKALPSAENKAGLYGIRGIAIHTLRALRCM